MQRENLSTLGAQEALLLIGQFGIGLLSAFSVADSVEVFTRSCQPGSSGFRWLCKGDIHYTVEPVHKDDVGTSLVLNLTDKNLVLLDDERLRQAIKRYADFLSVPIFLKGNQVNSCTPPWENNEKTDFSDYIRDRYNLIPLAVLPFKIDDPLPLSGLLFVPMIPFELTRDFGEVDIYISRMFIKANDKELLPLWARFVKGLINTPSLLPTVSRNEIVKDAHYETIRQMLGEVIIQYLSWLEDKAPDTLKMVVSAYNNTIKARSLDDDAFFDRICDLVKVNTDSGPMSMKEYLRQTKDVIYYFSERGTGTQHKILFAHKGLPVVDASWGAEEEFLGKYAQRKKVKLERLESGSGTIFQNVETTDEKWEDLERQFKLQIHKEAKAFSFEPPTIPAVLMTKPADRSDKELGEIEGLGKDLGINCEKIRQMFGKLAQNKLGRAAGEDTILHLNINNPLILQLRDMPRNETFRLAITAIYSNALMFAQHYVSPQNAEIIFTTNNAAINAMISSSLALNDLQHLNARMEIELNELKRKTPQIKLNAYRSCFFAYPFQEKFHKLMDKLKEILLEKYGIKLTATSVEQKGGNVIEDIKRQIAVSHFGIADITGNNPNVLWELGLMFGHGKPVIILKNERDKHKTPFDLYGEYRLPYQIVKDILSGDTEYPLLEKGLERNLARIFELCPQLEKAQKFNHYRTSQMN